MGPIIGTLGGAWLMGDEGTRRPARSGAQSALLSLLILHARDTPLRFDAVAEALWPGRDIEKSRNALRVQTSSLRKVLQASEHTANAVSIETKYGGYVLSAPANSIDTEHFETSLRSARAELARRDTATASSAVAVLQAALDLWDEPYLELAGYLPADFERTRLTELREQAIDDLLDARIHTDNANDCIADLEARTLVHPHRERTYGQLMTVLYLDGRQADSLAIYQRARTRLVDDLGIEPGPALREIEAAVLAQTLAPAREHPAVLPERGVTLVGRTAESALLSDCVQSSDFVLVSGEPGIGKTSLLAELQRNASADQRVLFSTAPKDQTSPPLWPILSVLDDQSAGFAGDSAADFRRNQVLLRELGEVPTVVVIDDFQWVDEATARFVRQAIADPARQSTSFVLAFRSAPADLAGPCRAVIDELRSRSHTSEIELGALTAHDIGRLIELEGSTEHTPDQIAELVQRSGGNPLFIRELLRVGLDTSTPPSGVGGIVLDRLSQLSASSIEVLTTAAVIGDDIQIDLVLASCDASVDQVVEALDDGARTALLTNAGAPVPMPRFSHALIREALATRLSAVEQRRVHHVVARTLETRIADSPHLITRTARHMWSAFPLSPADRTVSVLIHAAQVSSESLAFRDAATFLHQAEQAIDLLDPAERQDRMPGLLCDLGYAQIRGGDSEQGRHTLARAAAAARATGDSAALTRAARCILEGRSPVAIQEVSVVELVEEALAASKGTVSEDRVQLLADLAALRYFTYDKEHRGELAQVAIDMADELGEPKAKAIASLARCTALNQPSTASERMDWAASAQRLAAQASSTDFVVLGVATEIAAAIEAGNHDRARRVLADGKQQLVGLQIPRFDWFLSGWDVLFAIMAGDLENAETASTSALMAWEDGTHPDGLAAFGGQLSIMRLLQGRSEELVDLLRDFYDAEPSNTLIRALLTFAMAAAGHGDAPTFVDGLLSQVETGLREDAMLLPTLAFATESAALVGAEPNRIGSLVDWLTPWQDHHVVVNVYGTGGIYWGSMHHALGIAHQAAGSVSHAHAAYAAAAAEHDRVGATIFAQRSTRALDLLVSSTTEV